MDMNKLFGETFFVSFLPSLSQNYFFLQNFFSETAFELDCLLFWQNLLSQSIPWLRQSLHWTQQCQMMSQTPMQTNMQTNREILYRCNFQWRLTTLPQSRVMGDWK